MDSVLQHIEDSVDRSLETLFVLGQTTQCLRTTPRLRPRTSNCRRHLHPTRLRHPRSSMHPTVVCLPSTVTPRQTMMRFAALRA